ncbi:hypothetical protein ACN28S_35890 [Cystobacter fuscus]
MATRARGRGHLQIPPGTRRIDAHPHDRQAELADVAAEGQIDLGRSQIVDPSRTIHASEAANDLMRFRWIDDDVLRRCVRTEKTCAQQRHDRP